MLKHHFRHLPLAKEANKLAEALKKEQDTSQWAGIPHEKLLQESFVEQLNSLQTIEQLAPLKAAKEHLPKDIINILELLGKADNIPFNQLYSLAEDWTDRYYTKVIKTFTQLLKSSFIDRQLVLVNMARALKFLESYGNRQTKLWKVQLSAPEYDSNIDGQTELLPDIQSQASSHVENTEEDPVPVATNSKEYPTLPQDSDRLESQSQPVLNHPEHSVHQDTEQSREDYQNNHRFQ